MKSWQEERWWEGEGGGRERNGENMHRGRANHTVHLPSTGKPSKDTQHSEKGAKKKGGGWEVEGKECKDSRKQKAGREKYDAGDMENTRGKK